MVKQKNNRKKWPGDFEMQTFKQTDFEKMSDPQKTEGLESYRPKTFQLHAGLLQHQDVIRHLFQLF